MGNLAFLNITFKNLLAPMCSGYGQTHSGKFKPFTSIDLNGIRALVDNPQIVEKSQAQWLIPSTLKSRTFKEQELNGSYYLLWADLDTNPKPLIELNAFVASLLDDCDYEIYASRSATNDIQKARILIPLAEPLNFNDWHACQSILNEKLNDNGFTPDPANLRAAQLCYLPNRGEFYASYSQRDNDLFQPLTVLHSEIETRRQAQLDRVKELETLSKAAKARREALSVNDLANTIGAFNSAYSVHEILTMAGYAQRGDTFRHPNSESGSFSASVKNNRVHTLSTNDPLQSNGQGAHDAFSAFTVLFANGDHNQALKVAGDSWLTIGSENYNKVKQREFMQSKPLIDVTALLDAHNAPTADLKQAGDMVASSYELEPYCNELLSLPHGLGVIQDYIFNQMTYPSRATAGMAAIATMGLFSMNNITVKSYAGLGLNEQYVVLAPTGYGKEDLRRAIQTLYNALADNSTAGNLASLNNPAMQYALPASAQAFHELLETNKAQFFLADEFAEWLTQSKSDSHKQGALGYCMEIYTKALASVNVPHATTKPRASVKSPRLGIFATSTAERMLEAMTASQSDSGSYNRIVFFVAEQSQISKKYDGQIYQPSDDCLNVVKFATSQNNAMVDFDRLSYDFHKFHDSTVIEGMRFKDNRFAGRLSEQAIKLAALIAISDKRLAIEYNDLAIAYHIRENLYNRFNSLLKQNGGMNEMHPTGKAVEQLKVAFSKHEYILISQLGAKSRTYGNLHVNEQEGVKRSLITQGIVRHEGVRLYSNIFKI